MIRQLSQKGFTLIEMLVYIAILVMVTTASVGFLFSLNKMLDQYRVETVLYRSGSGIMEQIMLALRQADAVNLAGTVEDDPASGRLTVINDTGSTAFLFTGGELQLIVNGSNLGDVTNDVVTVDDFTVYYYSLGGGEFVRVRLTLTGTVGGVSKQVTLYGGSVVRGSI
jgi:prepilin-type N-terminal cleavage/methylation domain-containing protein